MKFNYHLPVNLVFGRGRVAELGSIAKTYGKKALIVTGKSSAKNGALMDVLGALHEHGTAVVVFDETEENPSIEMVMRVRELGLQENVDFVIGIGGGSPMDAAKAIALMLYHKEKGAEFLYQNGDAVCDSDDPCEAYEVQSAASDLSGICAGRW